MNNTQLYAGLGRQCIWPKDISRLFLTSQPKRPRQRSLKAEAGWFGRESRDGKKMGAISERSETTNEDILIFFFQLDLATRAQVGRLHFSQNSSVNSIEVQRPSSLPANNFSKNIHRLVCMFRLPP